ncbi:hypothetical protein IMZ48_47035 [Candidatus Bathyarchaeota archaeon]|nr:hypothetical protein [Candidatus Bathyarchaeota archaeon]
MSSTSRAGTYAPEEQYPQRPTTHAQRMRTPTPPSELASIGPTVAAIVILPPPSSRYLTPSTGVLLSLSTWR